ncbi:peptidylprolyl isomerase [Myxococcota bacterium]|nr:peptidylprolyl isomerase [Myxococcota bacterium]
MLRVIVWSLLVWLVGGARLWGADRELFGVAEENKDPRHPSLLVALRSVDASLRVRAARSIGRMQTPKALDALRMLASDADEKVRTMAIFGLGQLGWEVSWTQGHRDTIKGVLRRALADPSVGVRRAAIEAVGKYAFVETRLWLMAFLRGTQVSLQAEALRALFRASYLWQRRAATATKGWLPSRLPLSQAMMQQMQRLSKSKEAEVRAGVAYYFARINEPQGLSILLDLADDAHVQVRLFALQGLQKLADPKGAEAALRGTTSAEVAHRIAALQALEAMKQAHRVSDLLSRDKSAHTRAVWVRVRSKGLRPPLALFRAMWKSDPSRSVRSAALIALGEHTDPDAFLLELIGVLHQQDIFLREAAVAASAGLGWRRLSFLEMALQDPHVLVRSAALMALAKEKSPRVWSLLQRALRSEELAERGALVTFLAEQKSPRVQEIAWDLYQKSRGERWVEVREEIAQILARILNPQTTHLLGLVAHDEAASVARIAQQALQKRGLSKPWPPAKARRASPYRGVRFSQDPVVVFETTRGSFSVVLFAEDAPIHVATVVGLVEKGFYHGLLWHRVIPNFVIQGGDPDGTGWGGGDFSLWAEINPRRFVRGTLGMPRAMGWDTGSVQLFFTHGQTPHLDGQYTVFGQIRKGFEVLERIERGDRIIRAYRVP